MGEVVEKPSLIRWYVYECLSQVRVLVMGMSGGRASQEEWKHQGLEKFKFGAFVERACS